MDSLRLSEMPKMASLSVAPFWDQLEQLQLPNVRDICQNYKYVCIAIASGVVFDCAINCCRWIYLKRLSARSSSRLPPTPAERTIKPFDLNQAGAAPPSYGAGAAPPSFKASSSVAPHQVIFFPDSETPCKAHFMSSRGCPDRQCKLSHSSRCLEPLIEVLNGSRATADVCMFSVTAEEFGATFRHMVKRQVKVRLLMDGMMSEEVRSQISLLRQGGVEVRVTSPSIVLHHKFVLIDGAVLLTGSFNWTWVSVTDHYENLIVSRDQKLVRPFHEQFEFLWEKYDPRNKRVRQLRQPNPLLMMTQGIQKIF